MLFLSLCSYPGRVRSFLSLCSYPGRVRSVSDLARGLPRSAPLHARGRDFYIFCALFGDPVINRYLQDINVLRPLYFDHIVYLFIMFFVFYAMCIHVHDQRFASVFWDN